MIYKDLENRNLPPIFAEGTIAEDWPQMRKELIELLAREEYGFSPEPPPCVKAETSLLEEQAWAGKAEHRQISLQFPTPKGDFSFPVDIILPISK